MYVCLMLLYITSYLWICVLDTPEQLHCAIVDDVEPPEKPDSPTRVNLINTKTKRSLDFTVLPESVEKTVKDSPHCNNNSPINGQCQLDNSFIVPLEESFTESTEVESLKRNICSSGSSPDDSKYNHEFSVHCILRFFIP